MTENEIISVLQNMCNEDNTGIVLAYYKMAKEIVINKAFPFKNDVTEIPPKYTGNLIEIAVYLLNKRGAEGETAHSENGISRTYGSASVPDEMLKKIIPSVGVLYNANTTQE